jgi:hypothetical protein
METLLKVLGAVAVLGTVAYAVRVWLKSRRPGDDA